MKACEQCGFVHDELAVDRIAEELRSAPDRYRRALSEVPPSRVRQRPKPEVWSALEYVCHVRDVLLLQRDRVVLAQVEVRPSFARMYRDERVRLCRYDHHDLGEVLGQLAMAAELCAMVFEGLSREAWQRPIVYNWPEPAQRDLAWLGRHSVHEVEHHLRDIATILAGS